MALGLLQIMPMMPVGFAMSFCLDIAMAAIAALLVIKGEGGDPAVAAALGQPEGRCDENAA